MEKSDSIVALTKALIKAQGELEVVSKDTQAYNYKYATLPAVFEEYKKHFLKCGLVVIQQVEGNGLRTTLSHESGEWVSSLATLMPIKNDPQAQGSAITYMRRYALGTICGIMSEEDDDGAKAMPEAHKQAVNTPTRATTQAAGSMSPSGPHPVKSVIGIIEAHSENGEWHKYTIKGIDLSSKTPMDIETLTNHYENKDSIAVEYSEVQKGKFTNRYVKSISIITDVPF